jgi:hypothetical protein
MANNTFKEWYLKKEFANLENKICQTLYEHMNTEEKKDCDNFRIDEIVGAALGAANLALNGASLGLHGIGLGAKAVKGIGKMAAKALEPNKNGWKWLEKVKKSTRSILSTLWKAIKVLGIAAVIGAFIYVGFRFESIRSLFPMLAPYIDKAGELVGNITVEFAKNSFIQVAKWSVDFATWIMSTAMSMFGVTSSLEQAKETLMNTSEKANDIIMNAGDAIRPNGSVFDNPSWTRSSKVGPTGEFANKYIPPNISSISHYPSISREAEAGEFNFKKLFNP